MDQLGCAIGDQSLLLSERGAEVIGVDSNEELLAVARARGIARASFLRADLRELPAFSAPFDGIWSSWGERLRPDGWIGLVEVDDMWGHLPLSVGTARRLEEYALEAARGRYDFSMGRKLAGALRGAGWTVIDEFTCPDRELAFQGPASPEVLEAWDQRLERFRREWWLEMDSII